MTLARSLRLPGLALSAVVTLCAAPRFATAQIGVISGSVVDASTDLPLTGSTVVLRLAQEGTLVSVNGDSPAFIAQARQTVTGEDGRYRFTGLAPARYELRVQRMGYLPATLGVELRGDGGSQVSIGLTVAAVRLEPMPVEAEPDAAFHAPPGRAEASATDDSRIAAARARQREFASTDVREITMADVLESVTLGEDDLFRALQRLPGVDTYGDYTAELWTRGARWDLTRTYFDGVPLFSPLHTTSDFGGNATVSGLGTDVIGGALLFPGVRPARIGEGAAAVLDLRSRPTIPDGHVYGVAELTLLSARMAVSRGAPDGRSGWAIAGRHAMSDLFRSSAQGLGMRQRGSREYFDDLTGRWDRALGAHTRLQISGLYSHDSNVQRSDPDGALYSRDDGHDAAIVGLLVHDAENLRLTQRIGLSDYARTFLSGATAALLVPGAPLGFGDSTRGRLVHVTVAGELTPASFEGARGWSAGYEITRQRLDNRGVLAEYEDAGWTARRVDGGVALTTGSIWGEYRWRLRPWLRVDGGLRLDGSAPMLGSGSLRAMPRIQTRMTLDSSTSFSLGMGRSYQYAQAVPVPRGYNGLLGQQQMWQLANAGTPVIRSDIATVGAEHWASDRWLLSAAAYVRSSAGLVVRDPTVSDYVTALRTALGRERARGVELAARRLAGRITGSLAYTIATSRVWALGRTFPADEDRPSSVDATALVHLTSRLELGAAYTRSAGRPYTASDVYVSHDDSGQITGTSVVPGERNALRGMPYQSLDLLLDWSGTAWGARTGVFLQLRNVTGNDLSPKGPFGYGPGTCSEPGVEPACLRYDDYTDTRMSPFTPMLGIRIAF